MNNLHQKNKELKKQLDIQINRNERMAHQLAEALEMKTYLADDLQMMTIQFKDLNTDYDKMAEENDTLVQCIERYQNEMQKLRLEVSVNDKDYDDLLNENRKIELHNMELEEENKELKEENLRVGNQYNVLKKHFEEALQRKVIDKNRDIIRENKKFKKDAKMLQELYDSEKEYFHEISNKYRTLLHQHNKLTKKHKKAAKLIGELKSDDSLFWKDIAEMAIKLNGGLVDEYKTLQTEHTILQKQVKSDKIIKDAMVDDLNMAWERYGKMSDECARLRTKYETPSYEL